MSGISIRTTIDDTDSVIPRLAMFVGALRPGGRTKLNRAIGHHLLNLTRDHLTEIARSRHDTAQRLGARPSGHWAQAAEKARSSANAEAATVTIRHPGISRVGRDVTITPGEGKKFLAIPLIAAAYNQRAYRQKGLFVLRSAEGALFLAKMSGRGKSADLEVWYLLVRSVKQKQDRSLLPSDEQYSQGALEATRDYVAWLLNKASGAGGAAAT
jgi:hypothetical protein